MLIVRGEIRIGETGQDDIFDKITSKIFQTCHSGSTFFFLRVFLWWNSLTFKLMPVGPHWTRQLKKKKRRLLWVSYLNGPKLYRGREAKTNWDLEQNSAPPSPHQKTCFPASATRVKYRYDFAKVRFCALNWISIWQAIFPVTSKKLERSLNSHLFAGFDVCRRKLKTGHIFLKKKKSHVRCYAARMVIEGREIKPGNIDLKNCFVRHEEGVWYHFSCLQMEETVFKHGPGG